MPAAAKPRSLSRTLEIRGNGCGEKNARGNGSKLTTSGLQSSSRARASTCASSAWWPRCRPSNAPTATTLPPGARQGPATSLESLIIARVYRTADAASRRPQVAQAEAAGKQHRDIAGATGQHQHGQMP